MTCVNKQKMFSELLTLFRNEFYVPTPVPSWLKEDKTSIGSFQWYNSITAMSVSSATVRAMLLILASVFKFVVTMAVSASPSQIFTMLFTLQSEHFKWSAVEILQTHCENSGRLKDGHDKPFLY